MNLLWEVLIPSVKPRINACYSIYQYEENLGPNHKSIHSNADIPLNNALKFRLRSGPRKHRHGDRLVGTAFLQCSDMYVTPRERGDRG